MDIKSILRLTAVCAVLMAFVSCSKRPATPSPRPEPEKPSFTEGLRVVADYYGDYFSCGYDNYLLYFTIGEIGQDGHFVNGGVELRLDLLVNGGGLSYFPAGKYRLVKDDHKSAGILPSVPVTLKEYLEMRGEPLTGYTASELASVVAYDGSSLYVENNPESEPWLAALDEAELEVEVNGGEYIIRTTVTAGQDRYRYQYCGPLAISDNSQLEPAPGGSFTMEGINEVYAYNDGHVWGDDTDDWFFFFYNTEDEVNEFVVAEILTESKGNAIPEGKFTVPADFFTVEVLPAGILCPLYLNENDNGYYGTYYGQGDNLVFGASTGTMTISKNGTIYNVKLAFFDEEENADFEIEYNGGIVSPEESIIENTKAITGRTGVRRTKKVVERDRTILRPASGVRRMDL